MPVGGLGFSAGRDGQVEIQSFSSRQAVAFKAVPAAEHFFGDAEVRGDGREGVSFADLVVGGSARIGAGVGLLARGDGDDEPRLGAGRRLRQRSAFQVGC